MPWIDVAVSREARFRTVRGLIGLGLALALSACAGSGGVEPSAGGGGGFYKIGKPYQVNGIWYYPAVDYTYDETGIASWYGPGFHQERTANGETFDQNELSAAHKTLPMPSLVRVTNLDNGRSIVVRLNDRGPFVTGRILDMSRRCAQLLGFEQVGTAKVHVQILAEESQAMAAAAQGKGATRVAEAAPLAASPLAAAPSDRIEVRDLPPPKSAAAVPTTAPPPAPSSTPVAGSTVDGRFLPAPVVALQPVTGARQIYIQAGAFTQYTNASRLRDKVAAIAPAIITQAQVGPTRFYRVRLGPIESVAKADGMLARVVEVGSTTARLVVD